MPPHLALLATIAFVSFLFWWDIRQKPAVTGALWVPLTWVLITGSRALSQWIGVGGTHNTPADLIEGSPLDRVVFLSLQLAGLFILFRRRVSWSRVFSRNIWLTMFLVYCAVSILWSDFPFVAFKRWFKTLGLPIMVLILATEPDPKEAVVQLLQRVAYVLVPFSILLIKYFPELGRDFSPWSGLATNTGVTTNKNELGYICLILGFFFIWHVLSVLRRPKGRERQNELILTMLFLAMTMWLLYMSHSATSVMSLAVGVGALMFFGLRFVNARHSVAYLIAGLLLFAWADIVFGLTDILIAALGRDPTLSGRRQLWNELLAVDVSPIVGAGFESFWLGKRVELLWSQHWWRPNQAHNGYLETYLNLGWIGVILFVGWIASSFWNVRNTLLSDRDLGRFRLGILVIVLVYNYTEASFKGVHPMWLLLYIAAMDYPRGRPTPSHAAPTVSHLRAKATFAAHIRNNPVGAAGIPMKRTVDMVTPTSAREPVWRNPRFR